MFDSALPENCHGSSIHVPPELGDMWIGFAPLRYQCGKLLFGQPHVERAHSDERAGGTPVTKSQLGNLPLLTQVRVLTMLFNRNMEHLAGGGAVDVAAGFKYV